MIREIKFRAWHTPTKQMLTDVSTGVVRIFTDRESYLASECKYMQFIGLKDKNSRDIYEGDILQQYLSDSEDDYTLYIGTVEYFSTEFCLRIKSDTLIKIVQMGHNLEVIGNIYQDNTLLNKHD